ncbi:hypothetical protein A5724_07885 [Mycobacterium sp. ACS1612]|nr:hypothetical protein A5724_07885 [Mycobacterium sp. ACS1612]
MILGGCAVAVFAMLSAVTAQFESAPTDQAAGVYVGVTAATKGPTVPPHRPPIPFAKPAITGPAKLPPEEQGLPGD